MEKRRLVPDSASETKSRFFTARRPSLFYRESSLPRDFRSKAERDEERAGRHFVQNDTRIFGELRPSRIPFGASGLREAIFLPLLY